MSSTTSLYGTPETRRRILDTAWRVLEERGSALTLAHVAQGAKVSRQAVYLHFGDRVGLLVALVDHIDESLGRDDLRARIHGADTGVLSLRRWVEAMSWYTAKIDPVCRVLEAAQYDDDALASAWRDRMTGRQAHIRRIIERIHAEGRLAKGWSVEAAIHTVYVVTMPGAWRELVVELGWSERKYAKHVTRLLERSLVTVVGT